MENQTEQSPDPYRLTADQQRLFNRAMWIVLGIGIGWLLFADKEGYLTNVFTELLGVAGTFFVLDYWVRRRDERQKVEELKAHLLREARSPENVIAKHAIHELQELEWLRGKDGLLKGKNLSYANLKGAKLFRANLHKTRMEGGNLEEAEMFYAYLRGADMPITNFQRAQLLGANFQEAYLLGANFQEADLRHTLFYKAQMGGANLQRANLYEANLEEADIEHAELQGAYLYGANLRNAKLDGAKFDVRTVLPDSGWDDNLSRPTSFWTPDTDMSRFTDTDHPNFWQPEWAKTRQEK